MPAGNSQAHRTIRTALNEAVRRGHLARNPASLAKAPRLKDEEIVKQLYLTTLSRYPRPEELKLAQDQVARSADPPISHGIFCAKAFRTLPELSRVATPFASAGKVGRFLSQPEGRL